MAVGFNIAQRNNDNTITALSPPTLFSNAGRSGGASAAMPREVILRAHRRQSSCSFLGSKQEHKVEAAPWTSTYWPGVKCAAVSMVPTGRSASSVTLNSVSLRFMGTPAHSKCPSCLRQHCPRISAALDKYTLLNQQWRTARRPCKPSSN